MSLVEAAYQRGVDAMTPAQRISQMLGLYRWARGLTEREVLRDSPNLSAEELKWQVALRFYGSNLESRRLIEEQLSRVGH